MSDPRPRCPYCNSKQTRHTPSKSNIFTSRFTCRGCGHTFEIDNFSSDSPKVESENKGGCLKSIFKLVICALVVFIGFCIYIAATDDGPKETKSNTKTIKESTHNKSPSEEEFTQDAEKAAHEYIPSDEDYKKLEQTQKVQKSDNLTIVETTRKAEQ